MSELVTSAQMRAIEGAAIGSGAVTGLALMERAGKGVVEAVFEHWPELAGAPGRAVVLCGPGNNGGDGFVVARLLAARGWSVEALLYGDPGRLPPDARANCDRWRARAPVAPLDGAAVERLGAAPPALVVDALFGTGLTRPFADPPGLSGLLFGLGEGGTRVVAVDIPSGYCADSGRWLGTAAPSGASLTVTFHLAKRGHYLDACPHRAGRLVVKDIGLDPTPLKGTPCTLLDGLPCAPADLGKGPGHKYAHGHALVLSGPAGRTGAARLAARAALRVGAGLVTVAAPQEALAETAAHLTAIMLTEAGDGPALSRLLEDPRLNVLALGPGLGQDRARDLVPAALAAQRASVLDADALSAFAEDPAVLFAGLHEGCVLTPHGGEFARLFPDLAGRLAAPASAGPAWSKVDAAAEAATRAGCTLLLKGPDTVIADPGGRIAIHGALYGRAAPWLATAGSGDVLTGLIAGLLARGFTPMTAAGTAAWLHSEAARAFGPGLIAEDLPEELPAVFGALGL